MGDGGLPVLRSAEATEWEVPLRFPSRRSPLEEGRHSRGMAGKAHLPGEGDGVTNTQDHGLYHFAHELTSNSNWAAYARGEFPIQISYRLPSCCHAVTLVSESCLGFAWREAA